MDMAATIIFCGLVAFVIWAILQSRYLFVIQIRVGKVVRSRGRVPQFFLEDVEAICRENPSFTGTIRGLSRGKQIRLVFSSRIPGNLQQRFRNAWFLHA